MSKATKQRFVTKRLDAEFILPGENELIGKVIAARGRDLHEVLDENGKQYLASMPTRFRTTVYVKRDQFVYLLPIDEGEKGEITHVLDTDTILYVRELKLWPESFEEDALAMTRNSKRSGKTTDAIDEDMLPPSGSEYSSDNDSTGQKSDEEDDSDEPTNSVYNPNR